MFPFVLDCSALGFLSDPGFLMSSRLLYLDIDEPQSVERVTQLNNQVYRIASMIHVTLELKAVHTTKNGFHAVVNAEWPDMKELTPAETVCLQLLLGSDPKREAFNLLRAHTLGDAPAFWQDRWNVLYYEKL